MAGQGKTGPGKRSRSRDAIRRIAKAQESRETRQLTGELARVLDAPTSAEVRFGGRFGERQAISKPETARSGGRLARTRAGRKITGRRNPFRDAVE